MSRPPVDYTVNRIRKALAEVVREEYIDEWLLTPNSAFGNRTPYSLILDCREEELLDMIYELKSGIPG